MPRKCRSRVCSEVVGRWVYRAGGIDHHHSIFIARLNHSVDAALDLGEEEETKKVIASRDLHK
jgi:hypothetical protein